MITATDKAYCVETFIVKPSKRTAFLEAMHVLIAATQKEAGCLQYDLLEDEQDDHRFVLLVAFETKSQMQAHEQQAYIIEFAENTMNTLCDSVSWVDLKQPN